jgi:hypothetical protein
LLAGPALAAPALAAPALAAPALAAPAHNTHVQLVGHIGQQLSLELFEIDILGRIKLSNRLFIPGHWVGKQWESFLTVAR